MTLYAEHAPVNRKPLPGLIKEHLPQYERLFLLAGPKRLITSTASRQNFCTWKVIIIHTDCRYFLDIKVKLSRYRHASDKG
jgi:hypothetical protein